MKTKKGHRIKVIIISILSVLAVIFASFFIYVSQYYHATSDVDELILKEKDVEINDKRKYYSLVSKNQTSKAGLIFYPGGKVEAKAYIPLCYTLAQSGFNVFLTKMPFNLAVFDKDAADGVLTDYPEEEEWYLAGHSLGGAMAASYINSNHMKFKGLILLGAYSTADLSKTGLKTMTIYGSEDGVMNRDKYKANYHNLPADNQEVIIQGGSHCFFGNYGFQKGDHEATITREEQQKQTALKISGLLS
ncbi:MAG: alpha/beta hydrolase [Bacilli bacterium]|nr:alpha/beta hydrolase [Bacilli bacterium]